LSVQINIEAATKNLSNMAIANPRIHVICGICGNGDKSMFEYSIPSKSDRDFENEVHILCKNCSSITGLDELMDEEAKKKPVKKSK
jgi:hypothetical protein